jgi:hypothetical protein
VGYAPHHAPHILGFYAAVSANDPAHVSLRALISGRGKYYPLGPADHGHVLQGDHLPLLEALQGDQHPLRSIRVVELQYR